MSVLPNDTIRIISECVGISNLSDEIASQLASDVEYRIREITQEAIKFMKHSKRENLNTDDINNALRLKNIEMLYGYSSGASANESLKFCKANTANQAIYYFNDKEINFQDIISQPLPKCPREPTLSAHWLALEGVQPLIPQNPSPYEVEEYYKNLYKRQKQERAEAAAAVNNNNTNGTAVNGTSTTTSTSSAVNTNIKGQLVKPQESIQSLPGIPSIAATTTTVVKPTVKHVLPKEIQMFYEKITYSIKHDTKELFDAAINSLKNDSSLHQLLPYFISFISIQVTQNLNNLDLLIRLMSMTQAILESKHLNPELYLHQLMPSILTCLVGKKLCSSPTDNHWYLRDFAARLVSFVCRKFGKTYNSLQGRITKTLIQTLHDTTKPLTTHYGAIVGLSGLGRNVIQLLLIPYIPKYYKLLSPELNLESNPLKSLEAHKVLNALTKAVGIYFTWISEGENILTILDLKTNDKANPKESNKKFSKPITEFNSENILSTLESQYQELFDIFGEKLLPFIKSNKIEPITI